MVSIKAEYPSLSDSAVTVLRLFVSTCLCESACSTLTATHRSCMSNVETVLRPALTHIEQRLDLVCRRKQLHPSQYINVFAFLFLFVIGYLTVNWKALRASTAQMAKWYRASGSEAVYLSLIPGRVKPMTLKLVFTASLLDVQY